MVYENVILGVVYIPHNDIVDSINSYSFTLFLIYPTICSRLSDINTIDRDRIT